MGTPKSSISRWDFPYKPSIIGLSYGFPMVWGSPFKRLKGTKKTPSLRIMNLPSPMATPHRRPQPPPEPPHGVWEGQSPSNYHILQYTYMYIYIYVYTHSGVVCIYIYMYMYVRCDMYIYIHIFKWYHPPIQQLGLFGASVNPGLTLPRWYTDGTLVHGCLWPQTYWLILLIYRASEATKQVGSSLLWMGNARGWDWQPLTRIWDRYGVSQVLKQS